MADTVTPGVMPRSAQNPGTSSTSVIRSR